MRDLDGNLRGFYNTCRHRGHELLEPGTSRNLRAIKCPYHAWVYQLDGSLGRRAAVRRPRRVRQVGLPLDRGPDPGVAGLDLRQRRRLGARRSPSTSATSTGSWSAWEPERLFVGATHEYVIDANWKTITENYHECYHCPSIHPELCVVTPPDSGENYPHDGLWVGGSMVLKDFAETMSLTGESGGVPDPRPRCTSRRREVYYFGLFPNLLLSLHPDYVMTHRFEPLGPGPEQGRVPVAVPARGQGAPGLLARLRERVLGHHEQGGLARLRVRLPGPAVRGVPPGAVRLERGRGPHLHGDGGAGLPRRVRAEAAAGARTRRRRRLSIGAADLGSGATLTRSQHGRLHPSIRLFHDSAGPTSIPRTTHPRRSAWPSST